MRQSPAVRPAIFHPAARDALKTFPVESRRALGQLIFELQQGVQLAMPRSRPMPAIALGAHELRVRDQAGVYRAFYYLKSAKGILILHAVAKKTQKTRQQDIDLAKKRLREFLEYGAFR
jgi:phage-related protein